MSQAYPNVPRELMERCKQHFSLPIPKAWGSESSLVPRFEMAILQDVFDVRARHLLARLS